MNAVIRLSAFLFLLLLAPTAHAQATEPDPLVAYKGAAVLDLDKGAWRRGLAILVRGERIEGFIKSGETPAAAEIVDVTGLYAIPGLIDAHQHVANVVGRAAAEAMLRREIFGGVTAIRDMAGDARILAGLARSSGLGEIPAPDIYYSAFFAGPSFFIDPRMEQSAEGEKPGAVPWMQAIGPDTNLPLAVAMARGSGASGIKVYANLDAETVRRITSEAHRQGLQVWAHGAIFPAGPLDAVAAGADGLSHICMLAYQAAPVLPSGYHGRAPLDQERLMQDPLPPAIARVFEAMKARAVPLDTTLSVYRTIERMRAELGPERGPPTYCDSATAERLAGQAYRAGVILAAGTDSPASPENAHPALIEELVLLRDKAGLPPVEVIRSATINAARAIGQEADMGALTPGKLANIAFLSEDPLQPGARLESVALTVKRGVPFWRRNYIQPTEAELLGEMD